uniref:TRAF-type domain-containing protein n=1 Tax=Glossina brevipalpis TaxID=37001 RepID=A0A1A9WUZ9_9MUSC
MECKAYYNCCSPTAQEPKASCARANQRVADVSEQPFKKQKLDDSSSSGVALLPEKLSGLFSCVICWNLPETPIYQCVRGHLMCDGCFYHLLADRRLRNVVPTCPSCREHISKDMILRNLAVEEIASAQTRECQYCNKKLICKLLDRHERDECEKRPVHCRYSRIGCQWLGQWVAASEHEGKCLYLKKSVPEILKALDHFDVKNETEKNIYIATLNLLNHEDMAFVDLRFKPYRVEDSRLYFATRFFAFNREWMLDAFVNNNENDPHRSFERCIMYQLTLKTEVQLRMEISYFAVKGPHSSIRTSLKIYRHTFSEHNTASGYKDLSLIDSDECNRLLANYDFSIRFFMSMSTE